MSDDETGSGDGADPAMEKSVDLADLTEKLKATGHDGSKHGAALKKAADEMRQQTASLRPLEEQIKSFQELAGQGGAAAKLAEQMKRYSAVQEDMARMLEPYRGIQERMKSLGLSAGEDSVVGRVAKQIADQERNIEAMRSHIPENLARREPQPWRDIANIKFPANPVLETNERLERIEQRFEQMQGIAADAAQIANGLQAAAAEFLQKFEAAAADNDRTAARAIRIGVFAVIIAIAMPAVQIGYSELRRMPDSGPEIQSSLAEVRTELTNLREAQVAASVQIEEAISLLEDETAAILRDIRNLLSGRAALSSPAPQAPPQ